SESSDPCNLRRGTALRGLPLARDLRGGQTEREKVGFSSALSPRGEHSPGMGLGLRLSDAANHPWAAGRCPPPAPLCESHAARVAIGPPVAAPACRSVHVHPPLLAGGKPPSICRFTCMGRAFKLHSLRSKRATVYAPTPSPALPLHRIYLV